METVKTIDKGWDIISTLLPWFFGIVATLFVLSKLVGFVLGALDHRRLLQQKTTLLELMPPASNDKTPYSTYKLFTLLYGLMAAQQVQDKFLRRKVVVSLEIVGTRPAGIKFLARVSTDDEATFKNFIHSFSSEVRIKRVKEYLPDNLDYRAAKVMEFRQTGHFAFPLRVEDRSLEEHDPIAYITGAMTQLKDGEMLVLQVVASPVYVKQAASIAHKVQADQGYVYKLNSGVLHKVVGGLLGAIEFIPNALDSSSSSQRRPLQDEFYDGYHKRDMQLIQSIQNKMKQPHFRVSLRALIIADDKQSVKERSKLLKSTLDMFSLSGHQSLKARYNFPAWLRGRYRMFAFKNRLPSLFASHDCLLAASELADLYHFPYMETTKTENVVKSLSKTLSAPLSLKNGTKLDVLLGRNHHLGSSTDIGLTADERERHVFVVGGTGAGKTTLLKYAIVQDIRDGKGVAVIDPHGDLAQELLAYIPEDRVKDVIYFNPSDVGYPIGLNLLEVPKGLTGDQLLKAKDFIAETVVSIMRKTFSDDGTGGHRIEYVLRNAVLTALTVKDATLFTVYDLLTNKNFRKPIVDKLEQDWLKNFWRNEFSKAGDYQQVKMMSGVTSKIGRYHASVSAERVLEQPKSTIDFEEILDGKILICNLAKGLIGEDTSEVFGISILAKLQLASFRRIEQKRANRQPFYAYVDEFQNFATVSFTQMLSEARKYKLFLIMAEQTTSQQDDDKMVNTILTNAGTIICFKSNSLADERQMLHLFNGRVDPGEMANLPSYNFYAKLSGGTEPQDPVSGMTVVLDDEGEETIAEAVIIASRKNYAKKYVAKKKKKTEPNQDSEKKNDHKGDNSDADEELPADSEKTD